MKFTRKSVAGIAVVGALTLGATIPALAQNASDDTGTESTEDSAVDARELLREEHRQEFADRVGEIVGVEGDELLAAFDQVREELREEHRAEMLATLQERLDDAVANGRLTQEEADEIMAQAEAGELRPGRGHRRGGHGPGHGFGFGPGGPGADGTADAAVEETSI